MKLREYLSEMEIDEATSGKQMDKLVNTLRRAMSGQVGQQGMIALGFDLRSPANNNESKLIATLGPKLGLRITEDDLRGAMKELGIKSASQVVQAWNRSSTAQNQTRTAGTSLQGSAGKKQF